MDYPTYNELDVFSHFEECFTDLDGSFSGRLASVIPLRSNKVTGETTGTQSKYIVKIKVPYSRELMRRIDEGMLIAIPNFKSNKTEIKLTLFEIVEIKPEHFGLSGLSDSSFYPLQMEIIEQSEVDWQDNDDSTLIIQVVSIPINYSLTITTNSHKLPNFKKGFEYPIPGSPVKILNEKLIDRMYNEKILKKNNWVTKPWGEINDPQLNPRIGKLNMFDDIPLFIDYDSLIRYHFGIFAFTGGGKSNLLSNLMRRISYHTANKIVIFDVSSEYPFLLADILADEHIKSKVILESRVDDVNQFFRGVVRPREFEEDDRFKSVFQKILDLDRVTHFTRSFSLVPTYQDVIDELEEMRKVSFDKPHYINAIEEILNWVLEYVQDDQNESEKNTISERFVDGLVAQATAIVTKYNVHDKSGLYAWATSRSFLKNKIQSQETNSNTARDPSKGMTTKDIQQLILNSDTQVVIISIADPNALREIVIELTGNVLYQRKREFKLRPYVLFVFDEAQEFVPAYSVSHQGNTKLCTTRVEALLRQGRKYGLGCCISTQRIAYLNTNSLQQLHSFFVGPLPRPYDRVVVSSTFLIDQAILEKTLEFAPGQFLLSSYVASGIESVPILFTADNNETELEQLVKSRNL